MSPEQGHKWFTSWLPLATAAGPFLTVGLAVVMCVSLWWMNGWLTECVEHSRHLTAQLVTQQEKFHSEMLRLMAQCSQPH